MSSNPQEQGTHHFIVTRQVPATSGFGMATWTGHITPALDATRLDTYLLLLAEFDRQSPQSIGGNVIFFALESNQL